MLPKQPRLWTLLLVVLPLLGCQQLVKEEENKADLIGTNHLAADALIQRAGERIEGGDTIIAASFVSVDNLEQSSSFGRMTSEQVASQFATRGFKIVDILLRNNVYIKSNSGEFLLSREVKDLSSSHHAQGVLVGTYAAGRDTVFVNSRLIRATDGVVIAAYDYTLPMDRNMTLMLRAK